MFASSATSLVRSPSNPLEARTWNAVSTIISRRTAALRRRLGFLSDGGAGPANGSSGCFIETNRVTLGVGDRTDARAAAELDDVMQFVDAPRPGFFEKVLQVLDSVRRRHVTSVGPSGAPDD